MKRLTCEQRLHIIKSFIKIVLNGKFVSHITSILWSWATRLFLPNHEIPNKRNHQICSEENSKAVQNIPMHTEKFSSWCGLWAYGNIGPHLLKDDDGRNGTATDVFCQKGTIGLDWYVDGATVHIASDNINQLKGEFVQQIISCSRYLTLQNYFCEATWTQANKDCRLRRQHYTWGFTRKIELI